MIQEMHSVLEYKKDLNSMLTRKGVWKNLKSVKSIFENNTQTIRVKTWEVQKIIS